MWETESVSKDQNVYQTSHNKKKMLNWEGEIGSREWKKKEGKSQKEGERETKLLQ